jgi:hypothetical protein
MLESGRVSKRFEGLSGYGTSGASFTIKSIPTINCGFQSYDQGVKNNLGPELTLKVFHRW